MSSRAPRRWCCRPILSLTPLQVKLALQGSASLMPEAGLIAAGAGSLNVPAAIAMAIRSPAARNIVTTIAGEQVKANGVAYQGATANSPERQYVDLG